MLTFDEDAHGPCRTQLRRLITSVGETPASVIEAAGDGDSSRSIEDEFAPLVSEEVVGTPQVVPFPESPDNISFSEAFNQTSAVLRNHVSK